tara:strand:- start:60 stop:404 length:345 start_codon:yes stop_codon:yes gene_type:complete
MLQLTKVLLKDQPTRVDLFGNIKIKLNDPVQLCWAGFYFGEQMGKMNELLIRIENEFSPQERETAGKIAQQLIENPALYMEKFKKNKGTKTNDKRTSDTSLASGGGSSIEQPED